MKKIIATCFVFGYIGFMVACSGEEDLGITSGSPEKAREELLAPVVFTMDDPAHEVLLDGKSVIFTLKAKPGVRNKALSVDLEEVGPYFAVNPRLVKKGKYEKYLPELPQFDFLLSYQTAWLRMDEYRFDIDLPKEAALDGACELTALTEQGFATIDARDRGYTLISKISHTEGYKLPFQFFIQYGKAYDPLGRPLCWDVSYPIPGADVEYSYSYYGRE